MAFLVSKNLDRHWPSNAGPSIWYAMAALLTPINTPLFEMKARKTGRPKINDRYKRTVE